jgi:hypothetical protein
MPPLHELDELDELLTGRRALLVLGPGSTRAATVVTAILESAGFEPGASIDGQPVRPASSKRRIVGGTAKPPPFVVDGGRLVASDVITRLGRAGDAEHVLLVLEGTNDADARAIATAIPERGLVVADAGGAPLDAATRARITTFATDRSPSSTTPIWLAALVDTGEAARAFDLYGGGSWFGRFATGPATTTDLTAALGALVAAVEGFGADVEKARRALTVAI